ncbi:unnamed protein product [Gadus morhua 'NCC']
MNHPCDARRAGAAAAPITNDTADTVPQPWAELQPVKPRVMKPGPPAGQTAGFDVGGRVPRGDETPSAGVART